MITQLGAWNAQVRKYAVSVLSHAADDELLCYLLQLVQVGVTSINLGTVLCFYACTTQLFVVE